MAITKGAKGKKLESQRNLGIYIKISKSELSWLDMICKMRKEANMPLCSRTDVLLFALKKTPGILIPPAPEQACTDQADVDSIYNEDYKTYKS